ncbi:hypothetical protein SRHO_G00345030 [Serrasalmus rhombeus]
MLAKHLSIDWAFHIPYHPQSSGMVERVNRTIKGRLRKAMQTQNTTNWVKVLPVVLAELRMTRTDTLGGVSPYEIVMADLDVRRSEYTTGLLTVLNEYWERVNQTITDPPKVPTHAFKPGDQMPHGKGLHAGLRDATPAARIPASHLQHQQYVCVLSRTTVTCHVMPHQLGTQSTGRIYTHTSAAVTLTVSERPKATVNVQPAGHVFIRERVTLTCEIESGDDWNYEWYKNNNLLRDAQRKKYEISNVDQTHAGDYTCKGTQSTGRIYTHTSAAVTLTVSERPKATVNVQPAGHVFIRERVTLTCEIESGDDWNYEWYKNNNLLRDAQRKKYEISNVDQTHAGAPVSALSLLSRLMAVSPFLLVSIVLGVKCYRARAGPDEENRT